MTDHAELRRLLAVPTGSIETYIEVASQIIERVPALLDELDRLKGELRVARLLGYPVCKRHAVNDYVDLRPDSPGCPFCLYDENATLKSTLAGVRALPGEWREPTRCEGADDVWDRAQAACADELQAKLGE